MTATRLDTAGVWSQLSSDLRRFIRRRVPDDHTAADLLQETFVRIHRNIDTLDEAGRLIAWVYQIARNVIIDRYRKLPNTPPSLDDFEPAGDDHRPAELCGGTAIWLDELICKLDEPYREAVRLAEVVGLSQKEVADRLGLSLSAAKSRIQRGRVLLKNVLDRCCTFEFDKRGNLLDCDPKPDRKVCRGCDEFV